jgi:hypothetical protein
VRPLVPVGLLAVSALGCVSGGVESSPTPAASIEGIEEASGVTRIGEDLYIVGDHEPGTYYRLPLAGTQPPRIRIDPARLTRLELAAGPYAADLESINVLPDGRIVILSERLFCLLDKEGIVAGYDHSMAEFGGRGLEGLAVRPLEGRRARVAVLWEGGYPDPDRLPAPVAPTVCQNALRPVVVIHDLDADATEVSVKGKRVVSQFELRVPLPPGDEPFAQRFRAPDLVWHQWEIGAKQEWGFIVLLSSGYGQKPARGWPDECPESDGGKPLKYCYKWLQRFTDEGEPYGEPFDLADTWPKETRHENWEGMGWFEPGESLVFVYDEKLKKKAIDPQEAFVLPLPDGW